jgi:hypothetical protein
MSVCIANGKLWESQLETPEMQKLRGKTMLIRGRKSQCALGIHSPLPLERLCFVEVLFVAEALRVGSTSLFLRPTCLTRP